MANTLAASGVMNWLLGLGYDWLLYLDGQDAANTVAHTNIVAAREVNNVVSGADAHVLVFSGSNKVMGIACAPSGRVVAVGDAGKIGSSDTGGDSWTGRTAAASYAGDFYDVIYVGGVIGLFVAVGNGGEVQTSADGATWTHRTSGTSADLRRVAWNGTEFVAVGNTGVTLKSTNGTTWTAGGTINAGDFSPAALAFKAGTWVVSGNAATPDRDKTLYVSNSSGTTWTAVTLNSLLASTEKTVDVVCAQSTFIALVQDTSSNIRRMIRSTDSGVTWSAAGNTASTDAFVLGAGAYVVVVAPKEPQKLGMVSYDGGASWTQFFLPGFYAMGRLQQLSWVAGSGAGSRKWIGAGYNGFAGDERGYVAYSRMFTL